MAFDSLGGSSACSTLPARPFGSGGGFVGSGGGFVGVGTGLIRFPASILYAGFPSVLDAQMRHSAACRDRALGGEWGETSTYTLLFNFLWLPAEFRDKANIHIRLWQSSGTLVKRV